MKSLQPRTGLFYVKRFLRAVGHLISTYLSMILTVGFVVPWILGAIQIHNYEQVLSFIEVFVLVAATLSLLSFTYIMALTNMHEKVKKSMIRSGELFFMSTIQFIVGLFLFILLGYVNKSLLDISILNVSNLNFSLSLAGVTSILMFLFQFFVLFELIFAISKFFKGVVGIYMSFRAKSARESIFYLLLRGKLDESKSNE
jgi:hypothetical protein